MRPIDADALKANCDIIVGNTTIGRRDYVMFHEIDSAPTIDVMSVVHGEWIKNADGNYECSECHVAIRGEDKPIYPFCAWCGAKMKGADDETN